MKRLQLIQKSLAVKRNPHLWPGIPGHPDTEQELSPCVNVKHGPNGPRECGNRVWAGNGYADVDGAPFRAYYCKSCAAALLASGEAQGFEP